MHGQQRRRDGRRNEKAQKEGPIRLLGKGESIVTETQNDQQRINRDQHITNIAGGQRQVEGSPESPAPHVHESSEIKSGGGIIQAL